MSEAKRPSRDQILYEKSVYLRVYSCALLNEAKELCRASNKLRNTNARLAYDQKLIRSVGYFPKRTIRPIRESISEPDRSEATEIRSARK